MKIEQLTLDGWASKSASIGDSLRGPLYRLQQGELTPQTAHACLADVQNAHGLNNRLLQSLLAAGAADPRAFASTYRERAGRVTLDQMTSPANRRLAMLLREASHAARQVEDERGISGDDRALSETLDIYAEATERECYGPAGLGEGG